jgi:hypothetical protein
MANALVDALVDASLPGRASCAHLAIVDELLRMQAVLAGRDCGVCGSAQRSS